MRIRKTAVFRVLFVLMAFWMGMSVQAAGKKTGLSKKKLTLTVNSSKTLTFKGAKKKVRWSVSGAKIVAVRAKDKLGKKAVITAGKRIGTCYVTAKYGGKKYRCKILVKAKAIGNFKEKTIGAGSVDRTGKYIAGQTTAKKADSPFVNAAAESGVQLLKEALKGHKGDSNILISPDSILTALCLVENGAAGATLTEMEQALGGISVKPYSQYLSTLHSRLAKSRFCTYQTANSIWYKNGAIKLKKAYLQRAVNYFGADIYSASFKEDTVRDINSWVYNKTYGKIPSIINRLDPMDRNIVVNAVYFKGDWAEPYADTTTETFTKEGGATQRVPMLRGIENAYVEIGGGTGFIKPYSGGDLAFLGLLPPEGMSAASFVNGLTGQDFIKGYNSRITRNIKVFTLLPEFSYDYEISLSRALSDMGIRKAFTDTADFSKMTSSSIKIDEVLHKTHIELNKKGTEAAAVTAVMMKATSIMPQEMIEKTVYLNRPFVYAILDTKTGIPMFIGIVNKI